MSGIADQYRIIATGAGWRRRLERGRLRFDGLDRNSFLQALLTNDVGMLAPGQGSYNAYLTPQGRMIADLNVFAREDHLIADVPAAAAAALAAAFDNLIFTEQVSVSDVSDTCAQLSLVGGAAAAIAAAALKLDADSLGALPVRSAISFGHGFIARTDDAKIDSFDVVLRSEDQADLVTKLSGAGADILSDELWTALRIEAGRPAFGIDMDTETIPLEAGLLDRAISTTKGCYVGQEVIIRVLHRGGGRVARRLVTIAVDSGPGPVPAWGTTVRSGDRDVGRITSASIAPDGSRTIALAYVHRDVATPGQTLSTDPGGTRAHITDLAG